MRRFVIGLAILAALAGALLAPLPADDWTRIVTAITIRQPVAQVYDYVTTPGHWPQWHPSSLAVSGAVDHSLLVGERATEDFLVAGRRGRAVWTVIAREAPARWEIEGEVDGRKASVITYTLAQAGAGTRFQRELAYRSPNLLFALLNRLQIRARIEAESSLALERLKQVLEGGQAADATAAPGPQPSR